MNWINNKIINFILFFLLIYGIVQNFYFLFLSISFFFFKIYKKKKKIFSLVFFYIFFSIILFEFSFKKYEKYTSKNISIESNLEYSYDSFIGYKPKKNFKYYERKFFDNKTILDVVYSINNEGFRFTGTETINSSKCLVFYGGSITFGQSLNDKDTLPYMLGNYFNENIKIFNFGFNGYGPHQFLSYLDHFENLSFFKCKKTIFIYSYISDHVGRVVGKRSWGAKSPRYIEDNNRLIFSGLFSDYPFKLVMKVRNNWNSSKFLRIIYNFENVNINDEKLFVKVLKNIEQRLFQKFKDPIFIYVHWNDEILKVKNIQNYQFSLIQNFLSLRNTIDLKDVLIDQTKEYFNNIPGDFHPTKIANATIAKFLYEKLKNKIYDETN